MFEKYNLENLDKKVDIYAYAPPNNGKIQKGKEYDDFGKDLRTVENYKIYKDCGFNVLMTQTTATYSGEDFETSSLKMVLDNAYAAGIERVIILDDRIGHLSHENDSLIGPDKKFKNEQELDSYIAGCLLPYKDHPAFYGVQFWDEPHFFYFKAMGQLYRSIKRVRPETYIQANLLPLDTLRWMDERYPSGGSLIERRKKYLNLFLDETGADYLLYDDYPFCLNRENKTNYLKCLQVSAEVCRDRNVDFCFVAQSFSMNIGGVPYYYVPTEKEALFQIHLLMGFGLKSLSYFTYMPHGAAALEGENFPYDGALIDPHGKILPQYYHVQKAINEYKQLLPVLYHFNYVGSTYAVKTFSSWLKPLDYCSCDELDNLNDYYVDKEGVLINELKDKDGHFLYRVINVTDTNVKELENDIQTTTLVFDKKIKEVDVYKNGNWSHEVISDGKFIARLLPGEALYILF